MVVGHDDRRCRGGDDDLGDVGGQPLPQVRIEGGQRLVEQQQARPRRQCAGQGHALRLSAGQAVHASIGHPGQCDQLEHLGDPRGNLRTATGGPAVRRQCWPRRSGR